MKKWLMLLVLLAFVVVPASATIINTTVIANVVIADSLGTEFSGQSFIYTATPPTVIQELKLSSYNDNVPTHTTLTRNDGTTIDFDITTHAISLFQRQQTVSIVGGTSSTETLLIILYPVNRIFFAQTNDTPKTYYLIITDLTNFIDTGGYAFDLDTTRDAYLTLPVKPSSNPVRTVSISSPGGRFSGTLYYVNVNSLAASENAPANLGQPDNRDLFWLIREVGAVIDTLVAFLKGVASYVSAIGGLVLFVMAAQVFLTLVAAYTIIAAIISIHDSDDMFKSIGKFVKMELKLLRFFGELFDRIKTIIVWW